ncbi:hypothetical protein CDD80_1211 [Ophiocordyceps camponoti-rufipedis]|uniref:HTH APSES-type domain-containing protein n=1 Tax=Ophiocordyceps camponoti-rufipedis TaxID=2004952 RepID=A0A2C5XMJ7_9HYPO|nr:hypothetical protein CDD80_1211 [Ophiocordyceps camponoti-rufipedis]
MLSIQALLNPASPEDSLRQQELDRDAMDRKHVSRTTRTHGPIRFPPCEVADEEVMRQVARFHVDQYGHIQQYSQHIPYNSTKRNFYEKTGRESIEAFAYDFRIPGQQTAYRVMWDYNIGLVRMTPFFKCLGYPKNPGLREVSPSITGGSVGAQGYWVPYRCARALCATFCYDIAGALIPLFGCGFPAECTPPESPYFGDMVIGQHLVAASKMEAEATRNSHEARKGAAAWPDAGVYPRPPREECGPPWMKASSRGSVPAPAPAPMPVVLWNSTPYNGLLPRAEAGCSPYQAESERSSSININRLPPMHIPSRTGHHPPGPLLSCYRDSSAPVTQSIAPTEPWPVRSKRPWPFQEYLDTSRAKSVRLALASSPKQTDRRAKTTDAGGDDYAAAAVLVELQKEDHGSGHATSETLAR